MSEPRVRREQRDEDDLGDGDDEEKGKRSYPRVRAK